jgi:hypothetical protein
VLGGWGMITVDGEIHTLTEYFALKSPYGLNILNWNIPSD